MDMPILFQVARNLHFKMYCSLALKEIFLNSELLIAEISRILLCVSWSEDSLRNILTKFWEEMVSKTTPPVGSVDCLQI